MSDDPLVVELRGQILDLDRRIIDALNARLRLVAQLKRYKAARGLDFVDRDRERWMAEQLHRANAGPLSQEGLEEIFAEILDLTKREVPKE